MNIRVYAPNQISNQLQEVVNDCIDNLKTFFSRIKTAEVFITEAEDNRVEIKLYLMRRVLYTTDHADRLENALENAAEKMRKLLIIYQKEVAIF